MLDIKMTPRHSLIGYKINMKKRAIRRYLNHKVINQRLQLIKLKDDGRRDMSGKTYYERMKEEPGRLRDKPPFDCGKTKCLCCHYDKVLHKKFPHDKKIDDFIRDEMKENEV